MNEKNRPDDREWNIEWCSVERVEVGNGVCIHYCGDAADHDQFGPLVAFIIGFDWRRGNPHVVVEVMRDDAPVWRLVDAPPSDVRKEIEGVVIELLNGGSVLLRRGRLRVIANA